MTYCYNTQGLKIATQYFVFVVNLKVSRALCISLWFIYIFKFGTIYYGFKSFSVWINIVRITSSYFTMLI